MARLLRRPAGLLALLLLGTGLGRAALLLLTGLLCHLTAPGAYLAFCPYCAATGPQQAGFMTFLRRFVGNVRHRQQVKDHIPVFPTPCGPLSGDLPFAVERFTLI